MFLTCAMCEGFSEDWTADIDTGAIICPRCGSRSPFVFLPLHVLIGASGSGKTTIIRELAGRDLPFVTLDQDILWDPSYDTPLDGYRAFRERWLRLAANIHQSGSPTLLVGSGIPDQYELVSGRQFFSGVRYATLVCSEEAIAERLKGRPAWRGSGEPTFIAQMINYNAWLRENARTTTPAMTVFDTTEAAPRASADGVAAWASGQAER
jgi:AAA domain